MKIKLLSLSIVVLMVIGSIGAVGIQLETETNDDCGCSSSENNIDDYLNYLSKWNVRSRPPNRVTVLGGPPSSFSWKNADLDSNGHGVSDGGINFMTSVKSQGNCGSCWAFALMGVVEAVINIEAEKDGANHPDFDLSEQYFVSCASDDLFFYCNGCNGASFPTPWPLPSYVDWAIENDVVLESCFPYQGIDSNGCDSDDCTHDPVECKRSCTKVADVIGYKMVSSDRTSIKNALIQKGPLTASVTCYTDWDNIGGGVYQWDGKSPFDAYHQIVIVGYKDTPNNPDYNGYWIVKNSARFWGNSGYGKIAYGEIDIEFETAYIKVDYEGEPLDPEPDLEIEGSLNFGQVTRGEKNSDTFIIKNVGHPDSNLWWNADTDYPDFGYNWGLKNSDGSRVTTGNIKGGKEEVLTVEFTADKDINIDFSGSIKIYDGLNPSDSETVQISGYTPKLKHSFISNIFEKLSFFNQFFFSFFDGKLR